MIFLFFQSVDMPFLESQQDRFLFLLHIHIHIYYLCIWMNYNDLTWTSLEWLFRVVNHYSYPFRGNPCLPSSPFCVCNRCVAGDVPPMRPAREMSPTPTIRDRRGDVKSQTFLAETGYFTEKNNGCFNPKLLDAFG
jgi:hypothetical protein